MKYLIILALFMTGCSGLHKTESMNKAEDSKALQMAKKECKRLGSELAKINVNRATTISNSYYVFCYNLSPFYLPDDILE